MQDETAFCRVLGIQCFLQGTYSQVTSDALVCYTGHHTPVMEINDGAIVPDIPVLQEQVCEIRTPFLIT